MFAGLFLIIFPIVVTAIKHDEKVAQAHAEASASAAEAQGEGAFYQADSALRAEGVTIVTTIVAHTPKGNSPRTVPLSHLKDWLPHVADGAYSVSPSSQYTKTGHLTLSSNQGDAVGETYCLTVPGHAVSAAKIKSGVFAYVESSIGGLGCN